MKKQLKNEVKQVHCNANFKVVSGPSILVARDKKDSARFGDCTLVIEGGEGLEEWQDFEREK